MTDLDRYHSRWRYRPGLVPRYRFRVSGTAVMEQGRKSMLKEEEVIVETEGTEEGAEAERGRRRRG